MPGFQVLISGVGLSLCVCAHTWEGLGDDLVLHHDVGDLTLDLHRLARQLGEDLLAEQDVLGRFQLHVPGLRSWEDTGTRWTMGDKSHGNALLPIASVATSCMSGDSMGDFIRLKPQHFKDLSQLLAENLQRKSTIVNW